MWQGVKILNRLGLMLGLWALWACSAGTGGGGPLGGGNANVAGGPVGGNGLTDLGPLGSSGNAQPGMEEVALGSGTVDYTPTILYLDCKAAPVLTNTVGLEDLTAYPVGSDYQIQKVPAFLLSGKVTEPKLAHHVLRLIYQHSSEFRDIRLDDQAAFARIFVAETIKPEFDAAIYMNSPEGPVDSQLQSCPDSSCLGTETKDLMVLPNPSCAPFKVSGDGIPLNL